MKQTIDHPQIGTIELLPNRRCKGIRYSVSKKGARISFNPIFSDRVLPLPPDMEKWFVKSLQKLSQRANPQVYKADTRLQTLTFTIVFIEESKLKNNLSAKLTDGMLTIRYPSDFVFDNACSQSAIKNVVKHFLVLEAKRLLPNRLQSLAKQHGFEFKATKITTAHTRWGSCNSLDNISLSAYMLFLPEHLIDLILVHELCHTREMNHSPKFYRHLAKVFPNHVVLNKELKAKSAEVSCWI